MRSVWLPIQPLHFLWFCSQFAFLPASVLLLYVTHVVQFVGMQLLPCNPFYFVNVVVIFPLSSLILVIWVFCLYFSLLNIWWTSWFHSLAECTEHPQDCSGWFFFLNWGSRLIFDDLFFLSLRCPETLPEIPWICVATFPVFWFDVWVCFFF